MAPLAFTASLPLTSRRTLPGRRISTRPPSAGTSLRMSAYVNATADRFMFKSQTYEAKQAATPFGEYTVQCTEGVADPNTAEATRLATLAASFRLRQASPSACFADLYATRRAAIIAAKGSHKDEAYAVSFPARASATVRGRAEALLACSRYFIAGEDPAADYMFECVDRQYKALKVAYGVFNTTCADGRVSGDAETARVAAIATEFRSAQLSPAMQAESCYNSILEAVFSSRGCHHEDKQFAQFPKMAAAIRWGDGTYAARITGISTVLAGVGGKLATVAEQVEGVNLDSYWPSNEIRPAVPRKTKPWMPSPIKDYSPMSAAAVAYGVEAQSEPFEESGYEGWSAGWQPKSSVLYEG